MKITLQHDDDWLLFENPVEILAARTPDEVFQCLEKIEQSGLWAAGFVSYEVASAFDDALKTHKPGKLPLLQFGLFERVEQTFLPAHSSREGRLESLPLYQLGEWKPSVSRGEYFEAIAAIKEHIAAGDTYQVNYTFRLNADFSGDAYSFFCDLTAAQQGRYGAFIETDDFSICSASPEIFFELQDGVITSRPMKGTLPRGLTFSKDRKNAETLRNSPKDRAENIMIVDMIRNDLGRVAGVGSVETLSYFDVEKYPTVWQMTSTVRGELNNGINHEGSKGTKSHKKNLRESSCALCLCGEKTVGLVDLFRALFPCASITGAPKAKTMEIIQGLEKAERGVYTGSIGFIDPEGNAQFNVAIRTAVLERNSGVMEYGIGGGIVWDSNPELEYEEAITKSRILARRSLEMQPRCFQCLETMLWENGEIFLLDRHLKRLAESAEYFNFKFDPEKICARLRNLRIKKPTRIRVLLSKGGEFDVQTIGLKRLDASSALAIAKEPVDSAEVFLYHKTTNRAVYENAKAEFPEADDVLLYNERGEVTESCIANIVVEIEGRKVTPPISCGLLSGTFRDELLERGEIEEGLVTLDELKAASAVWLINSVRRWRTASLI